MRIAIVGGGIYGVFLALELQKSLPVHIDLYEKNNELMMEATTNNQHRLHLGFHYARSKETIIQSAQNYNYFLNHFKESILIPNNNHYLIHESSLVHKEQYLKAFSELSIDYQKSSMKDLPLFNSKQYTECIKVKEGVIFTNILRNRLLQELKESKINIYLNTLIEHIEDNTLYIKNQLSNEKYDIVINSTYYNASMGLKNPIQMKYELCCLLLVQNINLKDLGITIVDGNYVSLYPANNGLHTLSSVIETPFIKAETTGEAYDILKEKEELYISSDVKYKILEDASKYLNINSADVVGKYLTLKAKIKNDINDTREAFIIEEQDFYSIVCGKISVVHSIANNLIEKIKSK
jgi:hypothetical protein